MNNNRTKNIPGSDFATGVGGPCVFPVASMVSGGAFGDGADFSCADFWLLWEVNKLWSNEIVANWGTR